MQPVLKLVSYVIQIIFVIQVHQAYAGKMPKKRNYHIMESRSTSKPKKWATLFYSLSSGIKSHSVHPEHTEKTIEDVYKLYNCKPEKISETSSFFLDASGSITLGAERSITTEGLNTILYKDHVPILKASIPLPTRKIQNTDDLHRLILENECVVAPGSFFYKLGVSIKNMPNEGGNIVLPARTHR